VIRSIPLLLLVLAGCARVEVAPGPDPDCPAPVEVAPAEEPPPPDPKPVYGTRLGPYLVTYDDGTVVPDAVFLWDSEREEPCRFVPIESDTARCLPAFVWHSKPGWFADAACSQEVAVVDNCATLPRYIRDQTAKPWQTCAPAPLDALLPLGEPITGSLYQPDPLGNCVAKTGTPDAANVAMPILAPVPMTAFVAGTAGPQ
jgi:hypothetical protein